VKEVSNLCLDIRDNLKAIIDDKGYIQAVIAKKANMNPSKLSSILSKNRKLEANELFNLCSALDLTPVELKEYNQAEKGG